MPIKERFLDLAKGKSKNKDTNIPKKEKTVKIPKPKPNTLLTEVFIKWHKTRGQGK